MKYRVSILSCAAIVLWPLALLDGRGSATVGATSPAAEYPVCGESSVRILGFSDSLNKTTFGDFAVSELSALAYDTTLGTYKSVADRAGSVRSHTFELSIPIPGIDEGVPAVTSSTVLSTPGGAPFTGSNLDAEGIAIGHDGTVFVASEGGSAAGEQPEILQFAADGTHLQALPIPSKFLIGTNNVSFESLAESPGGHALFTANERPLASDGLTADFRRRIRIVKYVNTGEAGFVPAGEFYYLTQPGRTSGELGVAELLAISPDSLLVLERGFVAGLGNTIRVFKVSLIGAEDMTSEPSLATPGLAPLEKTEVLDLSDCPDAGATVPGGATQPNALLDNFEAMTFGPQLPGGMRSLILLSDDNGSTIQTTRIVVLGVPHPLLTPAP